MTQVTTAFGYFSFVSTVLLLLLLAREALRVNDPQPLPLAAFGPLLVGSVAVATLALLIAAPLGLVGAVSVSELAPARLRPGLRAVFESLAGVPSIVFAAFALFFVTPWLQRLLPGLGPYNLLIGGAMLGVMVAPVIVVLGADALAAVPQPVREQALALGGTEWAVLRVVVARAAQPAFLSALAIAFGRATAETVLIVVVCGGVPNFPPDPREPVATLTSAVLTELGSLDDGGGAVFALALLLVILSALVQSLARTLGRGGSHA